MAVRKSTSGQGRARTSWEEQAQTSASHSQVSSTREPGREDNQKPDRPASQPRVRAGSLCTVKEQNACGCECSITRTSGSFSTCPWPQVSLCSYKLSSSFRPATRFPRGNATEFWICYCPSLLPAAKVSWIFSASPSLPLAALTEGRFPMETCSASAGDVRFAKYSQR